MPKEKTQKQNCVNDLRHAEYYGMQEVFDDLYARSCRGEIFTDLMDIILSRENILLAYRNIKANKGSNTAGTDKVTIRDIGKLSPEEVEKRVRFIVAGSKFGYRPKPVRRKDIPKANGSTRPLGIPCMWDRLVQQCIKQVMEPICEARFSNHSYGFRPNRSVENAIAETQRFMQMSHLHYIIEVDIKGFFDNVNHPKLIKQIWAMGIQDKHLIFVLKRILTAKVKMPDGTMITPEKGTPQGGIISPLLANIVLNELDHWIESQWEEFPVVYKHISRIDKNGRPDKSNGYRALKETNLKEMRIVRYADDFRIFCRTKNQAELTKMATVKWLTERLKLEVSPEKTRVVNVKRHYSEFLGFKLKVFKRKGKQVVKSHPCDKAVKRCKQKLCEQAKLIARPRKGLGVAEEINLYNSMVMGWQNYYCIATDVSVDSDRLNWAVMKVLSSRLKAHKKGRLRKRGKGLTKIEAERYGKSARLRYEASTGKPIYPIGHVKFRKPMQMKRGTCRYTPEGRAEIHDNLRVNTALLLRVMRTASWGRSIEYADNRISLFSAQHGKCAVTGEIFDSINEIHCHHKRPTVMGGTDEYKNLVLVTDQAHRLIHARQEETIKYYLNLLNLNKQQLCKLNDFRKAAGLAAIQD